MEKKFKHKKTGIEAIELSLGDYRVEPNFIIPKALIHDSLDWEEVKEKSYTILSFRDEQYGKILKRDSQLKNMYCFNDGKSPFFELDDLIKNPNMKIFSILRNKDEEVFTIGDKMDFCEGRMITDITINKAFCGGVRIGMLNSGQGIETAQKLFKEKPILKTEDEVEIFDGDSIYIVNELFNILPTRVERNKTMLDGKYFSGNKSALEYIKWNKPMYSLNDIKNSQGSFEMVSNIINALEKLGRK